MAELKWDQTGERLYETGIDRVVLFPYSQGAYQKGVAWSGVTAVNENPSGAESTPLYADNIKYLNLISAEELGIAIEAYSSPEEFDKCDGTYEIAEGVYIGQQNRQMFGLCYRTLIGNDEEGTDHGYIIHLVYGCHAAPSEESNSTVNDSPEAKQLSWDVTTTPVPVTGFKPTASVEIKSTELTAENLKKIKDKLYGTASTESEFLLPDDIITLLSGKVTP